MATKAVWLPRLDGRELARALQAGGRRLLAAREHLDRINVFPVPDGDTGTNLALTIRTMLGALQTGAVEHAGEVLTRAADAALDGARGNSGAILSQFLTGVADRVATLRELSPAEFADAVRHGAAHAREAIAEPREGTILTVLQDFAAEVEQLARRGVGSFPELVRGGLVRARESLAATREQMDELRRANVVDAGAAGFVAMLEGISAYLDTGELDESAPLPASEHDEHGHAAGHAESLAHRWCTECMVTGDAVDRRHLRERLAALGSSLVVAGTHRKVRVHLHVADPAEVFRIAAEYGAVSAQKADDMQRQQEAAHHAPRRRVAIVADSAADIPDDELERLDIHLVPVRVNFGEHSYLDKVSLSPAQFYELLERSPVPPKTSQPPPGDFRRLFEFLASHYESVVSINVAGRSSGTKQAAEAAAARIAQARVHVVDTGNASLGQGLLAMHAAECAAAGMDAAEIVASVQRMIPRTRTFGCLATLDYGIRGGRLPKIAKPIAEWLRLTPLIANLPDLRVGLGGFLRGRRNLRPKFARFVRRRLDPAKRYRLLVGHANAPDEGERLREEIVAGLANVERSWVLPLGTALGAHGGPGMLVVGWQELDDGPGAPRG
ncbi:MAG: DegV family EDD domain-containing protein [Steroidobacteraceae bacterium]|nr:DegV family EDD domain-containing protein [Steroidobacteraceae bacterium]